MLIIEYAIGRSKMEILNDIKHGPVPVTVASFSELHDYVDANEYGGFCSEDHNAYWWPQGGLRLGEACAVQDAIDTWIKSDGIKGG